MAKGSKGLSGFEVVGGEPDGVAVGFAGLRAAALAHVGAETFAERNERLMSCADLVGEADDQFEVGADARFVGGLCYEWRSP